VSFYGLIQLLSSFCDRGEFLLFQRGRRPSLFFFPFSSPVITFQQFKDRTEAFSPLSSDHGRACGLSLGIGMRLFLSPSPSPFFFSSKDIEMLRVFFEELHPRQGPSFPSFFPFSSSFFVHGDPLLFSPLSSFLPFSSRCGKEILLCVGWTRPPPLFFPLFSSFPSIARRM